MKNLNFLLVVGLLFYSASFAMETPQGDVFKLPSTYLERLPKDVQNFTKPYMIANKIPSLIVKGNYVNSEKAIRDLLIAEHVEDNWRLNQEAILALDKEFPNEFRGGQYEIAKRLKTNGANIWIHKWSDLFGAVEKGNVQQVKQLLDEGVTPNVTDRKASGEYSVLEEAISQRPANVVQVVELLLKAGANPNRSQDFLIAKVTDNKLHDKELMDLLLKYGADINVKDRSGNTAFMYAAEKGDINKIQLLLNKGANPNAENNRGETAYSFVHNSYLSNKQEVLSFLKRHGAKENQTKIQFIYND